MSPEDFDRRLALARDVSAGVLLGRLRNCPILRPCAERLVEAAIEEAAVLADPRRAEPDAVFIRWFREVAWREDLRLVLLVEDVSRCLMALPPDQRRLLGWLYIDQLTFPQLAPIVMLAGQQPALRQQCRAAYDALRGRIAARLGEDRDAFPLFPAAAGWGF